MQLHRTYSAAPPAFPFRRLVASAWPISRLLPDIRSRATDAHPRIHPAVLTCNQRNTALHTQVRMEPWALLASREVSPVSRILAHALTNTDEEILEA